MAIGSISPSPDRSGLVQAATTYALGRVIHDPAAPFEPVRATVRALAARGFLADPAAAPVSETEAPVPASAAAAGQASAPGCGCAYLDERLRPCEPCKYADLSRRLGAALAAAGQAPGPQCSTCGHGQHTGPCMVLVGHVSRITSAPCGCRQTPAPQPDTLPEWLHHRLGSFVHDDDQRWESLEEGDRAWWRHEAAAVRRAVARGGFKAPAPQPETAPVAEPGTPVGDA